MFIQITGRAFCAGVELKDGRVVRRAPYLKRMIELGWTIEEVERYANFQGLQFGLYDDKGEQIK